MSDTPRTDALLLEINEGRVDKDCGPMVEHARRLERELSILPWIIRKSTWRTAELRESAAHLVETAIAAPQDHDRPGEPSGNRAGAGAETGKPAVAAAQCVYSHIDGCIQPKDCARTGSCWHRR